MNLLQLLERESRGQHSRRFGMGWDVVRQRVSSHPHEIAQEDDFGRTCLYKVCCMLATLPLDVLELMLIKDKEFRCGATSETLAACRCGFNGLTPLLRCAMELHHLGLPSLVPLTKLVESLELFMKHAPQCLKHVNCSGETVLHVVLASMNRRPPSMDVGQMELVVHFVCKLLVQTDPELVTISRNKYGEACEKRTPFHYALRDPRFSTVSLHELLTPPRSVSGGNWAHRIVSFRMIDVRDFTRLWTRFGTDLRLRQTDDEGNTPLHVVLMEGRTNFVQLLVDSNPEALRITNKKGELPLNLLLRYSRNGGFANEIDLIRHVVEAHPPALEAKHLDDGLYPFLLTWMKPNSVFQLLLSRLSLIR